MHPTRRRCRAAVASRRCAGRRGDRRLIERLEEEARGERYDSASHSPLTAHWLLQLLRLASRRSASRRIASLRCRFIAEVCCAVFAIRLISFRFTIDTRGDAAVRSPPHHRIGWDGTGRDGMGGERSGSICLLIGERPLRVTKSGRRGAARRGASTTRLLIADQFSSAAQSSLISAPPIRFRYTYTMLCTPNALTSRAPSRAAAV